MKVFYSPSNMGFYHEGIQKTIPEDAFAIPQEKYNELIEGLTSGKKIISSGQNTLTLEVYESDGNTNEQERAWRNSELFRADVELHKVQDADPKSAMTVADWRYYRKALRAWPEHVEFPKIEFRPKSPVEK